MKARRFGLGFSIGGFAVFLAVALGVVCCVMGYHLPAAERPPWDTRRQELVDTAQRTLFGQTWVGRRMFGLPSSSWIGFEAILIDADLKCQWQAFKNFVQVKGRRPNALSEFSDPRWSVIGKSPGKAVRIYTNLAKAAAGELPDDVVLVSAGVVPDP